MRSVDAEMQYREAFEDFSRKAELVQRLAAQNAGGALFENALLHLERAQLAYNQARDAFVRMLLPNSAQVSPTADSAYAEDVPAIAELLWENAGRPDGTAEADWLRAEAIVKHAVATAACH